MPLSLVSLLVLHHSLAANDIDDNTLAAGDECVAAGANAACALSAVQLRRRTLAHGEVQDADIMRVEAEAKAWQEELLAMNISMPSKATDHDGIAWPAMSVLESGVKQGYTHVFAIGDWGAPLPYHITYANSRHHHKCPLDCDYVNGVDNIAQLLVAKHFYEIGELLHPAYVLNVGDNFYPAGLVGTKCDQKRANSATIREFIGGWHTVYGKYTKIPWLSVLGNHDYGGWMYSAGWAQQIGYSYVDRNWVLPARFYSQRMNHYGFSVDYFMLDTNSFDAHAPFVRESTNICSRLHNGNLGQGADCSAAGGPNSTDSCHHWFKDSYRRQQKWLIQQLNDSDADWQVVVTHFPCGTDQRFFAKMHRKYGLDLLVTGHRHKQELWHRSRQLGGLTCFVTGGGGGITSEDKPEGLLTRQYGFFDLAISKTRMHIYSINLYGKLVGRGTVYRRDRAPWMAPAANVTNTSTAVNDSNASSNRNFNDSYNGSNRSNVVDGSNGSRGISTSNSSQPIQ